ncbi:MAG: hypothetical protein F9K39_13045 [Exiguobacterium chiriqhucha]|uniref:hypothetical protein n=1 Tax=Exiguobacterium chiriqhucha TaxID=1385984 RepID=UPI000494E7BA|nr:hypothetical protein [Exiguobacterium chiriqhucha]KAB2861535.1 MAG: hypothetical protein F9K39_13045 [Exiguobacterium chiriqhucha]
MNHTLALIEILLDKTASDAERDDAAIDLGYILEDEDVEAALLTVANDEKTDEMIRASCGESLAQIWIAHNQVSREKLALLTGVALLEAISMIKSENME